MNTKDKKEHLKTLLQFYNHLLDQGHTFWHCSAQDELHNKSYYYVQIHRSKHMSTCSTCYKLIELKKKIRQIQKELGMKQWPLKWYQDNSSPAPISANNESPINYTRDFMMSKVKE